MSVADDVNDYFDSVPPCEGDNVVHLRAVKPGDLPEIQIVEGELHTIATRAETALIDAGTPFYVRGSMLVRPVTEEVPAANGLRTRIARLAEVSEATMVDRLSRSAEWVKWNAKKKALVPADPTPKIAATILSRDGEWRFERLSGVITTPTLRPDGTILATPGYDTATQLLLVDPPKMPRIPDAPTKDDAQKALRKLEDLLAEFPFVDAASHAVALSALVTPVVRGAVSAVPMHATTAPVPGSGKSYVIDIAAAIETGERAPVLTNGRTEEETEKRLVAAVLSGQAIISIDNVNGMLGGDFLCQLIERPVVAVRVLGQSRLIKAENRASTFATGNNIQLVGDMTRRVLLCSLDPQLERPELRTFDQDPFASVIANRGAYVAAALTIVRAYVVAGKPGRCRALASFEEWSDLVRSALVWLGCTDPCETMNKARGEDPVTSALTNLFTAWYDAVGATPQLTREIKEVALAGINGSYSHPMLREALIEVAEDRGGSGINDRRLGKYLAKYQGRIVAGLKLVSGQDEYHNVRNWKVVKA